MYFQRREGGRERRRNRREAAIPLLIYGNPKKNRVLSFTKKCKNFPDSLFLIIPSTKATKIPTDEWIYSLHNGLYSKRA